MWLIWENTTPQDVEYLVGYSTSTTHYWLANIEDCALSIQSITTMTGSILKVADLICFTNSAKPPYT